MNERDAYIALNAMERVGPVGVRALVERFGSAAALFEASDEAILRAEAGPAETRRAIVEQRGRVDGAGEQARAERDGVRLLAQIDPEYPAALRTIYDPPLALYVKGRLESRDRHGIAVVGTRRPTHYGREVAANLGAQLATLGFTVVSGLARGVDTAAHEGALRAQGRTLAVIAGGFDHLYPETNAELAEQIAARGAVITEYPFDRAPDKTTFPVRNRIVSGLSRGVVVVEAGAKSGALITARVAAEQGRDVFAVPGRIDCPMAAGCHDLIRHGAGLVRSAADIAQEYETLVKAAPASAAADARPRPPLSDEEATILAALEDGAQDVDRLIRACGVKPGAMNAVLIGLEMKRLVRMLPGRLVELRR